MNGIQDLVHDALTDLTDGAAMPAELGSQALATGRRRLRRRRVLTGAAVIVAAGAVAVPAALVGVDRRQEPGAAPPAGNAIFAVRHTEWLSPNARDSDKHRWEVLDPVTGRYRDVYVKYVSEPSVDLRYAAVIARGDGDLAPKRIGRYETTTGALRWFEIPVRPEEAVISPDGRYAVVAMLDIEDVDATIVDLRDGHVRSWSVDPYIPPTPPATPGGTVIKPDGSGAPGSPPLPPDTFAPSHPVADWAADSRHVMIDGTFFDLDGRQTGKLQVPEGIGLESIERGGAGVLVRTLGDNPAYLLLDSSGKTLRQVKFDPPTPYLVSWRGRDQILVQSRFPDPVKHDVINLRTGRRTPIEVPHVGGDVNDARDLLHDFAVVIPSDRLSPQARDRVAF